MIPSIKDVLKTYAVISNIERMKMGRPSVAASQNAMRGLVLVCREAGIKLDDDVRMLTRKRIDTALGALLSRGISRTSAWSYVCQLQSVFAKWCRPYYNDVGWDIPNLELPVFRSDLHHYERPAPEVLRRVRAWYKRLEGEHWFLATMMLEFAMRNGDVLRISDSNFVKREDKYYLSYTPHKTALSSGRRVFWPVHFDIWNRIVEYGGVSAFDVTTETFCDVNRDMRTLGFHGCKGCYELRKICIDHIYQKYGAEMAVSISGDDIRTITRYYADPAQPNIGAVRVIDLI